MNRPDKELLVIMRAIKELGFRILEVVPCNEKGRKLASERMQSQAFVTHEGKLEPVLREYGRIFGIRVIKEEYV